MLQLFSDVVLLCSPSSLAPRWLVVSKGEGLEKSCSFQIGGHAEHGREWEVETSPQCASTSAEMSMARSCSLIGIGDEQQWDLAGLLQPMKTI